MSVCVHEGIFNLPVVVLKLQLLTGNARLHL